MSAENDFDLRLTVLEKELSTALKNISELERKVEKISDIALTTEKINAKMDMIREKIDYLDTRLRGIESVPAKDLSHYKRTIFSVLISSVLGTVIGAVMAVIMK